MTEAVHRLDIGQTIGQALAAFAVRPQAYVAMFAAVSLIGAAADTYGGSSANVASNLMTFLVGVLVTHKALVDHYGAEAEIEPHMGRAFGLSLLSGLGILVGLVLLIVPGLWLLVRWMVALPAMMREDLGITEALSRSTDLGAGNRWLILGLFLLTWVPVVLLAGLVGGLAETFGGEAASDSFSVNLVINVLAIGGAITSAQIWVQAYLTLSGERDGSRQLADIFA